MTVGDSLLLNLIPDPTQAGYYDLGSGQDVNLAAAKDLTGIVESNDPATQTLVVSRPNGQASWTVTLTAGTQIVLPDGSTGTFDDLSPGTGVSLTGTVNKRVHTMFDVATVQIT